ncbi:MAG: TolC family protein [Rhodothermales bacterium]|nr:TolC family protein [Rhodothermales bacterium]
MGPGAYRTLVIPGKNPNVAMRTPALLLFILWALTAGHAHAGQARPITSEEAVDLALEHSRTLESARSDAMAAEAVLDQTRTLRLPALSARGTYTRLSDNVSDLEFDLPSELGNVLGSSFELATIELDQIHSDVSLTQPIFSGFRISNSIQSARHAAEAARLDARGAEVDAAFRARQAFWDLVRAEAAMHALETAVAQMESHLQDARNRLQEGAATESEILRIRTRLLEIRADRIDAHGAVRLARMDLCRLTGMPLDTPLDPVPIEETATGPTLPDGDLRDTALSRHPALLALEQRSAALDARVGAVRADWFPDVTAFSRYQYARPNPYFFLDQDEFRGSWEAGVSATWTIWDWNRRGAAVQEARARLRSTRSAEADLRERIELEVERRKIGFESALQSLEAARVNVESASESFRLARGEYELGAALTSHVLDAESELRSAELRLADARAEVALAHAFILQVLGRTR